MKECILVNELALVDTLPFLQSVGPLWTLFTHPQRREIRTLSDTETKTGIETGTGTGTRTRTRTEKERDLETNPPLPPRTKTRKTAEEKVFQAEATIQEKVELTLQDFLPSLLMHWDTLTIIQWLGPPMAIQGQLILLSDPLPSLLLLLLLLLRPFPLLRMLLPTAFPPLGEREAPPRQGMDLKREERQTELRAKGTSLTDLGPAMTKGKGKGKGTRSDRQGQERTG